MKTNKCPRCGQFSNRAHSCRSASPGIPPVSPGKIPQSPNTIIANGKLKSHEILASARLMNTALGEPLEGGRSSFAQKQARIVLEQRFGKIDWSK